VGLAARKSAVEETCRDRRVSVGKNPEAKLVLANPEIIHVEGTAGGKKAVFPYPDFVLGAASSVRDRSPQNIKGETYEMRGEGLLARAFCHEIDT